MGGKHPRCHTVSWILGVILMTLSFMSAGADAQDSSKATGYFPPGTAESGFARDIMLIYSGYYSSGAGVWSTSDAIPYIAYGKRIESEDEYSFPKIEFVDWFFDAFLFLGLQAESGRAFDSPARAKPAVMEDWQWYLNRLFTEDEQLDAFEQGVAMMKERIQDPSYKAKVIVMIPNPITSVRAFGDVDGDGVSENFSMFGQSADQAVAARVKAVKWYIDQFRKRWDDRKYQHLEFIGYYWVEEVIHQDAPQEVKTVRQVADYVHQLGAKFFWIPWFSATGYQYWQTLGFDVVIMQPNYMFNNKVPKSRFNSTVNLAKKYNMGIEIEANSSILSDPAGRERYRDYLRAGVEYGYMTDAIHAYYQDATALLSAYISQDPEARQMYDETYEFVKGRYKDRLYPSK